MIISRPLSGFLPLSGGTLTGPLFLNGAKVFGRQTEVSGQNVADVALGGAAATIVSLALGNVNVGDRIYGAGYAAMQSGVALGNMALLFDKTAGTATIQSAGQSIAFPNPLPQEEDDSQGIGTVVGHNVAAAFEVTVAGTLTIALRGISNGGVGSKVVAGNGRAVVVVYRG